MKGNKIYVYIGIYICRYNAYVYSFFEQTYNIQHLRKEIYPFLLFLGGEGYILICA
jgi:hypothetical protein